MSDVQNVAVRAGGTVSGAERRRSRRVSAPPVRVATVYAIMQDVSLGGACLVLHRPHLIADQCELMLTDLRTGGTQTLEASVVWRARHAVGLRWLNLAWHQMQWLQARLAEWEHAIGGPVARCTPGDRAGIPVSAERASGAGAAVPSVE